MVEMAIIGSKYEAVIAESRVYFPQSGTRQSGQTLAANIVTGGYAAICCQTLHYFLGISCVFNCTAVSYACGCVMCALTRQFDKARDTPATPAGQSIATYSKWMSPESTFDSRAHLLLVAVVIVLFECGFLFTQNTHGIISVFAHGYNQFEWHDVRYAHTHKV